MGPIAFPFQGIGLSGQSDAVIASQAIATKRDRKLKGCSDEGGLLTLNAPYMDSSLVSARIRTRDQDRMQSYIRPLLEPLWLRAMMGIRAPRANQ